MKVLSASFAIAFGLLVLVGYFIPALAPVQALLIKWAGTLLAVAALIGVFNLIVVHGEKIRNREKGSAYSGLLVFSLLLTFVFGLALGPGHPAMQGMVNGVILPVEASLMAILSVTLLYAAIRLLRRRVDAMSVVFLLTVLLILGLSLPFAGIPLLDDLLRPWIMQVFALGGARGILIGVALGALTTGLRVLTAMDRPYGGK
ncbi:MAG: hypothetical protein ACOY0R_02015 [Chloroflexota bacterium]